VLGGSGVTEAQRYVVTNTNVGPQIGKLKSAGCEVVQLATVPGFTALALATAALDDASIKTEAALAVIKIAAPLEKGQKGLTGPAVAPALEKAIPLCPDATSKQAAEKYLATLRKK